MTDIALTQPINAILLTMQTAAVDRAEIQARIASGSKVRSAVEDPIAFATSQALRSRGAQLNGLMDGMDNAVSRVETAMHGIEGARRLVDEMRALVEAEIANPSTTVEAFRTTVFGHGGLTAGQDLNSVEGGAANNIAGGGGRNFNVTVADTDDNSAYSRTQFRYGTTAGRHGTTVQDFLDRLSTSALSDATLEAGTFKLEATTAQAFFITQSGQFINTSGFLRGAYWAGDELTERVVTGWRTGFTGASVIGNQGTRTFTSVSSTGAVTGATVATGPGTTVQDVIDQINADTDFGFTAELSTDGRFRFVSKPGADVMSFHMPSAGGLHGALGVVDGSGSGVMPTLSLSEKRVISARFPSFDNARNQLDDIVEDSGFAGIARADGDRDSVVVNERGTRLELSSVLTDVQNLGLADITSRDFAAKDTLETVLIQLTEAAAILEGAAHRLGRDLASVRIRRDFTDDLLTILHSGADALTLADMNEEGANLLSVNTRERLSSAALGITARGERDVLQLFG